MAAQSAVTCQHATLSTTVADLVTFSGTGRSLAVTNRDASVTLYFRLDGTTAVSAADETYVVLPLQTKILEISGYGPKVSIVGNGNAYSAEIF
jgi:hypothetical protein